VIELGDGQIITSTITRGSAERLELTEDDEVVP
jgi:molybdopterin-binding protein